MSILYNPSSPVLSVHISLYCLYISHCTVCTALSVMSLRLSLYCLCISSCLVYFCSVNLCLYCLYISYCIVCTSFPVLPVYLSFILSVGIHLSLSIWTVQVVCTSTYLYCLYNFLSMCLYTYPSLLYVHQNICPESATFYVYTVCTHIYPQCL